MKEIYPEELFLIIFEYAKKYSTLTSSPILDVIKTETPIYFLIGNYSWEFDEDSKYWKEFISRVTNGEEIPNVAYKMHKDSYVDKGSNQEWFGCFRYKYVDDVKTGKKIVKIHFKNFDTTGFGPLDHRNKQERIDELKKMFKEIMENHPEVEYVQGGSWLYNYDSYKRLFPKSFTENMRTIPAKTQYMAIWGQFFNSEYMIREDIRERFLYRVNESTNVEELKNSFELIEYFPKGKIKDFYDFYFN